MGAFHQFEPPPALSTFVDAFWCYIPEAEDVECPRLRVLPDGCIDLIARLDVGSRGKSVEPTSLDICGPTERHRLVGLTPSVAWAGVRFRIGAAVGPLLNVHPPEVFGQQVRALDCSPGFAMLLDRMSTCTTPLDVLPAMGSFLSGLATRTAADPNGGRTLKAVEMLGMDGGANRVSEVARAVGISERTLHREVYRSVGLSPKALGRILRFQRTLARLNSANPPDLCTVALESGYSDQSHMNRDFQLFSGMTPGTLGRSGPMTRLYE